MTKLATLRSQLAGLRRARSAVRSATAWSSLAIALLWALAGIFVLDLLFELAVPQRIIVMLLGAIAVVWAGWRFTRPLLGHSESEIDMALLVERQQRIDSDLVAALQFESHEAARWGSPQLEGAVIDYVASVGRGINVFEGFSRDQMVRRGATLGITLVTLLALAALFPGHAGAFFNRLMLGSMHYPTDTIIERIVVNRQTVLERDEHGSSPVGAKVAQGRPIAFAIQCSGDVPKDGTVRLVSIDSSSSKTSLPLRALTLDERLARLKTAQEKIHTATENAEIDVSEPWQEEVAALLRFDAPQAGEEVNTIKDRGELAAADQSIAQTIKKWPADAASTTVYVGELARLIDGVRYKVFLGDAWTDPATIRMIPLPVVEPRLTMIPPKYARSAGDKPDSSGRQISVLEGTTINLAIECTNKKPLQSAWMTVKSAAKPPAAGAAEAPKQEPVRRYDLTRKDKEGLVWTLPVSNSPLKNIREELRYDIQVVDSDGLSLETPIRGNVRIRPDRPPTASAEVVHTVVLPTAEPVIEYRATDDYGLSEIALAVEIERFDPERAAGETVDLGQGIVASAQEVAAEKHRYPLTEKGRVVLADRLPLVARHSLSLSPLKLAKGDRVKVAVEVTDYRGENEQNQPVGQSYSSDALVLEISDESGVLAAISEADQRSEERLTDIIKRQLGIGETP